MSDYLIKASVSGDGFWPVSSRKLVRESNGKLWCIYRRQDGSDDYQIYVSYSIDSGENWTEEQVTTYESPAGAWKPALAIDSSDNLHATWSNHPSAQGTLQYCKRTKGVGWGDTESIGTGSEEESAIAVDANDDVHVVWSDSDIKYRFKDTSEGTWADTETVFDNEYVQNYPSIAIDSNDDVHVAWYGGSALLTIDIMYRFKDVSEDTWAVTVDITDAGNLEFQSSCCIAVDSNNYPHIVWVTIGVGDYTDKQQIRYRSEDSGGWNDPEAVTNVDYHQDYPSIALDNDDNVSVVWTGLGWGVNTAIYNIQYRERTPLGGWQTQAGLTDDDTNNQGNNTLIFARHPIILSAHTNLPDDGYAFVYIDGTGTDGRFQDGGNLAWESSTGTAYTKTLTDSLNISSKLNYIDVDYYPTSPHVMTLTDSIKEEISAEKTLTEILTLVSILRKDSDIKKSENLTISETERKDSDIKKSENLTISETEKKDSDIKKSESLIISEAERKDTDIKKSENLTISETEKKDNIIKKTESLLLTSLLKKTFKLPQTEAVALSDALTSVLTHSQTLSDTFTLTEADRVAIGKILSETLNLSESISYEVPSLYPIIRYFLRISSP